MIRNLDLANIRLGHGAHNAPTDIDEFDPSSAKACAMEMVAYLAGEPWSDSPECACPVLSAFMRSWNDGLPDADRTRLLTPFLPRLIGSRSTEAVAVRRAYLAIDWFVRVNVPAWLRHGGFEGHAQAIEVLPEIRTEADLNAARPLLQAASAEAYAARSAAESAARSAAESAAIFMGGSPGTTAEELSEANYRLRNENANLKERLERAGIEVA